MIWAVPSTRDRVLLVDPVRHRPLVAAARSLDWLGRFRIVAGPAGSSPRVVDRDGGVRDGSHAVRFVLSRLPVTAWFALPTLLFTGPKQVGVDPGKPGEPGMATPHIPRAG